MATEEKTSKRDSAGRIDALIDAISSLTVTELAQLIDTLKEKFGVSGTAFVPAAAVAGTGGTTGAEVNKEEEKTEFKVTLTAIGENKIPVLKELRALTNLGLKEAKEIIDKIPSVVKEAASKEEAQKIKTKLEELGAKVELA